MIRITTNDLATIILLVVIIFGTALFAMYHYTLAEGARHEEQTLFELRQEMHK